ncbi:family 2 glycosyl transferase [Tolypothrix sp. NIES-4075]|uniref:glycosyltransferase family 2 protein n=1 Tax=Tolypothrix sp. NIES-4075 TaxID=2005459 RepID=UPI000B5CF266|nr:glycosyltransferase [Tolypothrix sp. NIES-4075]GAX42123.1 family 2 glycosyl transferase [Tolypothrix sp. NIES-4075]
MIRIAILIPSYNNEETISYTLESIQSQHEWIKRISTVYLADDCSSDRTIALAQATWNSPILLHILPADRNLGQWENVNRAINLIKETADWCLILHSDDIAKPNWLEMIISRIELCSEKIGSICSSWDNLMPDGSIKLGENDPTKQLGVIEGNDNAIRETLLQGCWWHISGCAIRLKTFEDCGSFNQKFPYQADWEWLLRSLNRGWAVEYIPRTLILYRQNVGSVSSKSFQTHQDIREFIEIIPNYINYLEPPDILHLHVKRSQFIIMRTVKSLITLNSQRFLQSFHVLLMLLISLKKCQKQSKLYQQLL